MSAAVEAPSAPSPAKKVVVKAKKAASVKKLATHPPANQMVVEAVAKLNEKGGSSLQAIKKFIAGFYNVDVEKMSSFIKKAIKKQVEAGKLTQTKGSGASGSFKLAVKGAAPKKAKKPAGEKKVKSPKKAAASPKKKVAAKPKKAGSPKAKVAKKPATKKAATPKKPKTPKKVKPAAAKPKKTTAAAKPKAPKKPKTMKAKAPAKPKAAKRAAPKKQ